MTPVSLYRFTCYFVASVRFAFTSTTGTILQANTPGSFDARSPSQYLQVGYRVQLGESRVVAFAAHSEAARSPSWLFFPST